MKEIFQKLEQEFREEFREFSSKRYFFAPGRVNLIGEHIDYSGGMVLPTTIQFGTFAIAQKNGMNEIRMSSTNMEERVCFSLGEWEYREEDGWGNYPKGIFKEYRDRGAPLQGLDIFYFGNIPGSGLSSSASIELCTAVMIQSFFRFRLDRDDAKNKVQMALLCQHSENHFNKVNCGIMDQAIIALGEKDQALKLDCQTLDFAHVPFKLDNYTLVIGNTNKPRKLVESKYNKRREETERSLALIQKQKEVVSLCAIPASELEEVLAIVKDDTLIKRTRHSIMENDRVLRTFEALSQGNLTEFGNLLNQSHQSLKDDFEVTGKELDVLVQSAWDQEGVLGARMTGAGFGGCMIALVEKGQVEKFTQAVIPLYEKEIGYPPEFYLASPFIGAQEIEEI